MPIMRAIHYACGPAELVHFCHRVSHSMNVIDVAEEHLSLGIVLGVLKTTTLESVCLGYCP